MRTKSIKLASWRAEQSEYMDIDWPKVQRMLGADQLKWLLDKPLDQCQLVVERDERSDRMTLIAEFYTEELLTLYHLMWAK